MRFPKSCATENKQRVVAKTWLFRDGLASGVRELVGRANDVRSKRVLPAEWVIARPLDRVAGAFGLAARFDFESDLGLGHLEADQNIVQCRQAFLLEAFLGEKIAETDLKAVGCAAPEGGAFYQRVVNMWGQTGFKLSPNPIPKCFFHGADLRL